jgi:ABC-type Fe3+ transport system substrate-binding protein
MKRLAYLAVVIIVVMILIPIGSMGAQTQGKTSDPQMPVTYPGDTKEAIARRAQWIEGAKKEGILVWWGILKPEEARESITEFNKIYPFIKVDYWRARGEEIATKLEAEYASGRTSADIALGGGPENFPRWAKMGIIEKFTNIIPQIDKYRKGMYGKRGDWVMPGFAPKVPQYNTSLVSTAELPKTFDDMLSPKWKGQLGSEVEAENWSTLALCDGGWGVEKTEKFLTRLKEQQPRFVQGGSATHSLLIAGEFKISVLGNLRHVIVSQEKKAPVDWIRISPVLVTGPSLILSKKGPHPNAARLFLEWQLSPKGLPVWAELSQNYVPGAATQMAKLLEGMPLAVRTEEVILKGIDTGLIKKINKSLYGMEN